MAAFEPAAAGTSPPHRGDVSGETDLHGDRRDSQLTRSVRTPGEDGPFVPPVCASPDQERKTEGAGRGEAGLTLSDKAATALSGPKPRRHPADTRPPPRSDSKRADGESGSG